MGHTATTRSAPLKVRAIASVVVSLQRIIGGVLVLAGCLKAYQLASEPFNPTWLIQTEVTALMLVAFEWTIGLWVVVGVRSRVGRCLVAALFAMLFLVSLSHAITGARSCGCFGSLKVSPWVTATFDVASAAVFVFASGATPLPIRHDFKAIVGPLFASIVAASMVWFLTATKNPTGISVSSDGTVLLEPYRWHGQRFELTNDISLPPSRVSGRWLVVIHRHGCAACEHVEETLQTSTERRRTIWLEVPSEVPLPLAHTRTTVASDSRRQLPANRTWLVQTPVAIAVHDGRVVGVTRDAEQMLIWANDAEQEVGDGTN